MAKKKLRVKPFCSIDGLVGKGKRLVSGVYVRGVNLSEEVFDELLKPKYKHAVEETQEKPEELAEVKDAPIDPADKVKQAAEKARQEAAAKSDSRK